MQKIIGLSGSLRRNSYNTSLLQSAKALMPPDSQLVIGSIEGIPLYNQDIEERGFPESVQNLKELIASADGLLLSTPEYNSSMPGVLKNAIDWLSRPGEEIPRIFGGKPVAIMGASAGPLGTALGQLAWLPTLRALQLTPWFGGRLLVPSASQAFDAEGRIIDAALQEQLQRFVAGFSTFVSHVGFARTRLIHPLP